MAKLNLKKNRNKDQLLALESWRIPYVREWQRHNDPSDPYVIKDKDRLKNLQDIVIFHKPI